MEDNSDDLLLIGERYDLPLQDQLVRIVDLAGPVKRGDGAEDVDGASQNGKVGRVESGYEAFCRVKMMDMQHLIIPRENLVPFVPESSEDGGFDMFAPVDQWSADEASFELVTSLSRKGYCLIQMPESTDMLQSLDQELRWYKSDFVCLPTEVETEYLGHDPASKVAWIAGKLSAELQESEGTSVGYYMKCISQMSSLVIPNASAGLNFTPDPAVGSFMIRRNLSDKSDNSLKRGGFTSEEKQEGKVGEFLDFVQRRKLCCMYFVTCEGSIELTPRESESDMGQVSLPSLAGKLLIFNQNLLNCACKDLGEHIIMQGWVLSEQRRLILNEFTGTENQMMEITGATHQWNQPMSRGDDIHFMSAAALTGGGVHCSACKASLYAAQTDCQIKVPSARWDHDYYMAQQDPHGWGLCQHSGFVDDTYTWLFDNELFGVSPEDAPNLTASVFIQTNCVYEALFLGGYTKETMRGANIHLIGADAAKETEMYDRYRSLYNRNWSYHYVPIHLVHYFLGLAGKVWHIDTACSASNVAVNLAYQQMRRDRDATQFHECVGERDSKSLESVVQGGLYCNDVGSYIGLSAAHMLGKVGRSMTFDNSANGYCRGEGTGVWYMKNDASLECKYNAKADMVGGFINQDGRSASLTAPNGPSQTAVVLGALKDAKRHPRDVSITELHGTGTALGDPVETGSVKVALNRDRYSPLLYQAGKSMTGHLEHGAGVTGIMKTVYASNMSSAFPQCHLRVLNGNIEDAGFPALWPTECTPIGLEWVHAGISSFGFGGTNVRTQIWTYAKTGPRRVAAVAKHPELQEVVVAKPHVKNIRKVDLNAFDCMYATCPRCSGNMCWLCGEADVAIAPGKHVCTQVRQDFDSYDVCSTCYKGGYRVGDRSSTTAGLAGRTPYIIGSWSRWTTFEEMRPTEDGGYIYAVRLRLSRVEEFQIVLDQDPDQRLYPVRNGADSLVRVAGPDKDAKGKHWLIDGSDASVPDRALYHIKFKWDADIKSVEWEIVTTDAQQNALRKALGDNVYSEVTKQRGPYAIAGSFSNWALIDMIRNENDENLWETSFDIGVRGKEEFQFVYGDNTKKAIYPAGKRVVDTSIVIKGPDDRGDGKNWLVYGMVTESVKVQLRVHDKVFTLTTSSKTAGERVWSSVQKVVENRPRYYYVGSSTNWGFDEADKFELHPDPIRPRVYKCSLRLKSDDEEFQISVDKTWHRIYHPAKGGAKKDAVQGPDGEGHGYNWFVKGRAGAMLQIILDLSSESKSPVVSYDLR